MMKLAIQKLRQAGQAVPEIMHLFRFKKRNTAHLIRFTDAVMRGPSPLSPGLRELIGTFVSSRNQCSFCSCAHAPVAASLLGQEIVDGVLRDVETSQLDASHKELFRYLEKVVLRPSSLNLADVEKVKQAGWSEEAIYDALTVASLFKFYNTWNNGAGVQPMRPADYLHSGNRLLTMGYCMDFGAKAVMKVMWVGRKEIRFEDLKALVRIVLAKLLRLASFRTWPRRQPLSATLEQTLPTAVSIDTHARPLCEPLSLGPCSIADRPN
jgi:uncharacterized peroxidase-related enzyme